MTDKKKQIEEMAEFIHVDSSFTGFEEDARKLAEELYKAGYRKRTECEDVSRFRGVFECSACHWTDEDIRTADPIRFCAGCGAKVKGGERE